MAEPNRERQGLWLGSLVFTRGRARRRRREDVFGIDEWGSKRYHTFFLCEAVDGYCFCFSQPA
jgi:hypothetical protein